MEILGLHIDYPFLRTALVQKERSSFKVCALKTAAIAEPDNVKLLYKPKFKGRFVSGLSSKDMILRSMDLNIGNSKHIEAALGFQSEGITHLKPADMISIPHSIKKTQGKVEALLFSASREALKSHLNEFEKLHIALDSVSSIGLALVHFIRWKFPLLSDAFIVDLGSHEWTSVLMEKGELKKTHALGGGTDSLLTALWEDRKKVVLPKEIEGIAKQIDLQQIKPNLNPHLSEKLNELRQELAKTIFSFHRISNNQPIIFTGNIHAFGHLRDFLIDSFKETISKEFDEGIDLEDRKYAIAIGLALEQSGQSLQFLTHEFFPKKNWQQAGIYALILCLLSLSLSLGFLCIGLKSLGERKKGMLESFQNRIEQWDPDLKNELFQNEESALEKWIAGIKSYHKEYPYILDVPKVAEVLSWLDDHPLLKEFKMENDPIEVKDLRYQMVEYPKIGSLQNRYKAKVELQFRVKSPMNARKFHEALLKGDETVDPSGEVSWEASNENYRVSFFLKHTKSPYVP